MASSLIEELKCSICLNLFREPHMLCCGHNFCLPCLESSALIGQNMNKCPECRLPFSRQELKHNRALANLVEKVCQLQLNEEPSLEGTLGDICDKHDKPLLFFCRWDQVPVCVICQKQPQHRGHSFLSTKTVVKYAKEKLKKYQIHLKNSLQKVNKHLMFHQKKMSSLETCAEKILRCISRECEELHRLLHDKEESFKKYVEEVKAKKLEDIQDVLPSLQEEVSTHIELNIMIKTALEMADDFAFLKDVKKLMNRVKKFQPCQDYYDDFGEEEISDEEEDARSYRSYGNYGSYGNIATPAFSGLKAIKGNPANKKMFKSILPKTSITPLWYSHNIESRFQYPIISQPIFPRGSYRGMFMLKVFLATFAVCGLLFAFIYFWKAYSHNK